MSSLNELVIDTVLGHFYIILICFFLEKTAMGIFGRKAQGMDGVNNM